MPRAKGTAAASWHTRGAFRVDGFLLALILGGYSFVPFGPIVLLVPTRSLVPITLKADPHHLMTDVWISAGVLIGIGAVVLSGWERLNPIIALLVAANIIGIGVQFVCRSALGLLDTALLEAELAAIRQMLDRYARPNVQFRALRTRQAGARRFGSMHVLVPGSWIVHQGNTLLEQIEYDIRAALPNTTIFTYLESLDEPASWQDMALDRAEALADATQKPWSLR